MKTISRYIMTLVALLALTTQAWADEPKVYTTAVDVTSLKVGDILAQGFSLTSTNPNGAKFNIADQRGKRDETIHPGGYGGLYTKNITAYGANATFTTADGTYYPIDENGNVGNAWVVTQEFNQPMDMDLIIAGVTIELPLEVAWDATTKTGTFAMPASDVVLTPIYAAATVYGADGQTEKMAYETLKEAFANVQDGDVIKLDWDVTLTEDLATPTIDGGVNFTLDFNGYTIDGGTTYQIKHKNDGDQLTFTDSSNDQLGGLIAKGIGIVPGSKFVFDAGRYNLNGVTAEAINALCATPSSPMSLAEGKEFVDLEGGAAANNGFTLRVGFKTFELTIGAGKFATFYMDQNITFAEQPAEGVGLYTISGIDTDRSTATVTQINSTIIPANTPTLVYNGGNDQQTVKLKVTTDAVNLTVDYVKQFKGTATDREFTADDMAANDYFALSGGKAFAPVKGTGTIAAHKCWLQFDHETNGSAPARQLTIVFDNDDATGVNEVIEVNEVSDDTLYDLNGRKLNAKPTRKGVYIKNGQKVVK